VMAGVAGTTTSTSCTHPTTFSICFDETTKQVTWLLHFLWYWCSSTVRWNVKIVNVCYIFHSIWVNERKRLSILKFVQFHFCSSNTRIILELNTLIRKIINIHYNAYYLLLIKVRQN
jgi:hypothetical protein